MHARSLSYIRQLATHGAHVSQQTTLHQYKNLEVKTQLKTDKTKRFRISKRPMWLRCGRVIHLTARRQFLGHAKASGWKFTATAF